jgi:hypothetical protein
MRVNSEKLAITGKREKKLTVVGERRGPVGAARVVGVRHVGARVQPALEQVVGRHVREGSEGRQNSCGVRVRESTVRYPARFLFRDPSRRGASERRRFVLYTACLRDELLARGASGAQGAALQLKPRPAATRTQKKKKSTCAQL